MLVRVEVRTRQGTLLNLPLDEGSNGIFVQEIEGLDPVKATLVSSSVANEDGEQEHSARREARDIVFKMGYDPDFIDNTVETLRDRLYTFFMPKSKVQLRFFRSNGLYVDIQGTVESFAGPLFTDDPDATISTRCFKPDFLDPNPVNFSGTTTDTDTETLVPYVGSVETGMVFILRPNRSLNEFTIYHRAPDGALYQLDFAAPLVAGDVLVINTIVGAKGATLTRANTVSSLLYGVSPQAKWIEFEPGDNHLRVYAAGAPIPFDIEYTTRYGGL